MSGWRINTNTPYAAVMPLAEGSTEFISRGADLTRYFKIGDLLMAKIVNVTSQMLIDISVKGPGLRKLKGGRILHVDPMKVPRIIGKQGSMISLIKDKTGCNITVGQNGIVWIKGDSEKELLAEKAVKMIEAKSHEEGLTEKMEKFLSGGASQ